MSLPWQNQANQNSWGSNSNKKETKWVRKTNNSSASSATNEVDNPYGGPALPHKTFGQPKVTLGNWYYKRYKIVLSNDTFECRDNGGAPHLLKWTCTFTCPLTSNSFTSGQYVGADKSRFHTTGDEKVGKVVWFHTKKEAEHAAAARALDCLNYMEKELSKGQHRIEYHSYCLEEPVVPPILYPSPMMN